MMPGFLCGSFSENEYLPEPLSLVEPSGIYSVAVVFAGISTSQWSIPFCFFHRLWIVP